MPLVAYSFQKGRKDEGAAAAAAKKYSPSLFLVNNIANNIFVKVGKHARQRFHNVCMLGTVQPLGLCCLGARLSGGGFFRREGVLGEQVLLLLLLLQGRLFVPVVGPGGLAVWETCRAWTASRDGG
jgi:hypothetical protein